MRWNVEMRWILTVLGVVALAGCDSGPGGARDAGVDAAVDTTYARCSGSPDCTDAADQCYVVTIGVAGTAGRFCSRSCGSDAECESSQGFDGACYSLEGTSFLCYQRCAFDSDCPLSSVCIEVVRATGGRDFVCVPDN